MNKILNGHLLAFIIVLFSNSLVLADDKCFYEYKAKKDDPLRLHVGILETNQTCDLNTELGKLQSRLETGGWRLIQVVKSFDKRPSDEQLQKYGQFIFKY